MTYPDYPDYVVNTGVAMEDDLDILLEKKMSEQSFYAKLSADPIILSDEEIT